MIVEKIQELQSASGAKAKAAVLSKYGSDDLFCKFLYYALNPLITFNLSEDTLRHVGHSDEQA